MTNPDKIAAVEWEARARGLTYGKLLPEITYDELEDIYARFSAAKATVGKNMAVPYPGGDAPEKKTKGRITQKRTSKASG